jgi:hypothetical protein
MANAVYPIWKQNIMQATTAYSLTSTNVRTSFVDTGVYTYSAAHQFYSSLSGGVFPNTRATGQALGSKTYNTPSAGTFDAADVTFSAFSNGSVSVEGIVIYIDDGTADASSPLVLFLDTSITGIPFTPSGSDVTIQWNASGIFTL